MPMLTAGWPGAGAFVPTTLLDGLTAFIVDKEILVQSEVIRMPDGINYLLIKVSFSWFLIKCLSLLRLS
jgi:hypothetical protein